MLLGRSRRILPLLLAAAMLFVSAYSDLSGIGTVSATSTSTGVSASNAKALQEAQDKKAELEKNLEEAQNMVNQLQGSKQEASAKVSQLESELSKATAEAEALDDQLTGLSDQISQSETDLKAAEAKSAAQYEDMKKRIQYMYENGTTGFLELLLTSGSLIGFLNALEYITMISGYDRDKLDEYVATQEEIKSIKEGLETDYATVETMKDAADTQRQTVSVLASQKNAELQQINANLSEAEKQAKAYEEEVKAQAEVLAQVQAAIAEEQRRAAEKAAAKAAKKAEAEANGEEYVEEEDEEETSSSAYGFIWPCPSSRRITSEYGDRVDPITGVASTHKGIDIGTPEGNDIVAVQSGTVILSQYSNSAGNYVIINHGKNENGSIICSVYMHASALCCSKGDYVSQGQVIAKVGTTGWSTGPHLHFGVMVDGNYVNPWGYL